MKNEVYCLFCDCELYSSIEKMSGVCDEYYWETEYLGGDEDIINEFENI